MRKTMRTRIMGTVLAAVCALSAAAAVSTVSASAASVEENTAVAAQRNGRACTHTLYGCNWNYSADSLNASITCQFDYCSRTCRFIATGVEQGETNAILKAKRDDGRWDNVPIRFTVDGNLNVTGEITGPSFITTF